MDRKIMRMELDRLEDENKILWAIYKTCFDCIYCIPGIVYGCEIQKFINLSGECNQKQEGRCEDFNEQK